MKWTVRQEEVMRAHCFLGARAVRDLIEQQCGVSHTVRAVEAHASRIHVSLAVRTVCPSCGAVGVNLNRQTGMCRRCTEEFHLAQERAFNELLERERAEADNAAAIDDVRRERDRLRQRNSRLCRKYGLESRQERGRKAGR